MKKAVQIGLQLGAFLSVFIIAFCVDGIKAEAYSWNTTFGNASKVIKVGDDVPVFDPNALNLQLVEGDNELQIYNSSGNLRATYSMFESNNYIWIYKNETFRITKVGVKDGHYVDLLLKNVSLVEGSTANDLAYINTSSNGRIEFCKKNLVNSDDYIKFLNMKLIDHDTSQEIPNQKFYMNSYVSAIDYSYGRFVKGYDKSLTTNYLFPATDTFLTNDVALDTSSSSLFDFMTAKGRSANNQGYFSVYGSTGTSGYSLGLASGINAASAIYFFNPNDIAIVPNAYPPLKISETATQNEDATTATFTMTQDLPMQRTDNYIPANDSFKLSISEENTDFLNITADDFELSIGGNEIPSTAYMIAVTKTGTTTKIDITFTSTYLSTLNTAEAGSTAVDIKQTSVVRNEPEKIQAAISDYLFTMPTSANLTYTFANGISKSIQTPSKHVFLSLTPPLTADSVADASARKGTIVGDLALENVITGLRNESYSWDTVTANFDDPTSMLDTVGEATIPFTLKSQTFGNTSQVNTTIHVKDFSLTYDANGGEGTAPPATTFDQEGVILADQGKLTRPKYIFEGWSTSADGTTKIYKPGELYGTTDEEAQDTTLFAIWKKQFYDVSTSWSESETIKSVEKAVDRSQTTLAMQYYWKTSGHATYEVNLMLNNDLLSSEQISNMNDQQVMTKENLNIPIDKLTSYGDNALELQFYQLDANGKKMSQEPNDTLKVTIKVDGSLQFKYVPEELNWTGRTIDQTKGTINRDKDNTMSIQILDSRDMKDSDRSWYVRASLTAKESVPFTFVWKQNVSSIAVPLKDAAVAVLDSSAAEKESEYVYGDKWNNDEGILLSSDAYLSIGDYSNKVAITWNLYDVKSSD